MQKYKKLIPYAMTALIGLAIAVPIALYRGLGATAIAAINASCLSDGFFVAGLLLTGFGALIWISTTGFFDIFSYAGRSLLVLFSPLRKPKELEHFYDYKLKKDEKRGQAKPHMLLVGVAYILLSFVCLFLYYNL